MNIDKIKQVIELQRELKKEGLIRIDAYDGDVLIQSEKFKEIFKDKDYYVDKRNNTYYYEGIYGGCKFITNNEADIFNN